MDVKYLALCRALSVALVLLLPIQLAVALPPTEYEIQKLLTGDHPVDGDVGFSVAVDNDTAVVGAPFDSFGGSAYIFTRVAGIWNQQQKLNLNLHASSGRLFGWSVAVSGDTVVIGAIHDHERGINAGAAYVFTRNASAWSLEQKLMASDGASDDEFGWSVAVYGNTAMVGSHFDIHSAGSVYVFTRNGTVWSQQQRITASDGASFTYFGSSVSVHGNTAAIGAVNDGRDGLTPGSGSAYVFINSGGTWSEVQKLIASDGASNDRFGDSIAVYDDTVVIGAIGDDDKGTNSGSAYVFTRNSGGWVLQQKLTAGDGKSNDLFGFSVALYSDTLVVGMLEPPSGSAYLFTRSNGSWAESAKLLASDGRRGDSFGAAVAIRRGEAMVGAPGHDAQSTNEGAVYVFSVTFDAEGPVISDVMSTPNPVAAGATFILSAKVDDTSSGGSNIASAHYQINGGPATAMSAIDGALDSPVETVAVVVGGLPVGVYDICVAGTDAAGNTGMEECTFLAVYDTTAGFVTGGGWIESPPGAYLADVSLTGKANFGFIARYKKGQSVPDGNTQFEFRAGNLNFHSTSYEWLVVAGAKGMFKGSGTINGAGNYGFMLTAVDAAISGSTTVDLFRIKIWDKSNGDATVYDNDLGSADSAIPTTGLAGGAIVIHAP